MPKQLIDIRASAEVQNLASSKDFKIGIRAEADELELMVYGVVGDSWEGLDAGSVGRVLSENKGKPVNVRLNSPGGLAYDGITIYNALVQHDAPVTTTIEGIAASAASIIAMAGDKIRIAENGSLMIHRAWGIGIGNSQAMLDLAEFLDGLDQQIAATYAARTGRTAKKMLDLMVGKVDGTTFYGKEAVDEGFADEVMPLKNKKKDAEDQHDFSPEANARLAEAVKVRLRLLEIGEVA